MDISKRYEHSHHHTLNIKGMNWLQTVLTLAQFRDFTNVIKPRYEVKKVSCRLAEMIHYAEQGIETDWSFLPIHKIKRYEHYPRTSMKQTEELWRKQMTLPLIINKK